VLLLNYHAALHGRRLSQHVDASTRTNAVVRKSFPLHGNTFTKS
jgi:hypothetical protein